MKQQYINQNESILQGQNSRNIQDIQDIKQLNSSKFISSSKESFSQKQNSRKQSGETIFGNDFFGNTIDTCIDTIEEQSLNQVNDDIINDYQNDQFRSMYDKQKTPTNFYSSFRNYQSDKSSIFQRFNSNLSQQDSQKTNNQKFILDQSQNNLSINNKKNQLTGDRDEDLYPQLNILRKTSSILLKNNLSLNLSSKHLSEQQENKNLSLLSSKRTIKTEKSDSQTEDRNQSGLYKLQRMLNEDKIYFDKKNIESQNPYFSLQISQNGLVKQKNPGIKRQNTMLLKKANLIEQQKELSTPKNHLNVAEHNFSHSSSTFKESIRSDNSKVNQQNQSDQQISQEQQIENQFQYSNKEQQQQLQQQQYQQSQNSQVEQNESINKLFLFYNTQAKKKKNADHERFQKRRQNETRIYNEFEPRLKTFTKFGFKMIEKEQNDYLKPFMREFQANEPKGTMYVSDLWSDVNILKFLGNCRMIRDKLVLIKLAQKYQSRENLLKQINNSNQLYFSNGRVTQQEMYNISSILKKIYSENKQKGGSSSGHHTPRTPGKERDSLLFGQKASILNRKEELNLMNTIHMNEVKKSHQKIQDKTLIEPFQQKIFDKNKKSYLEQLQQNSNRRLSKPKTELISESLLLKSQQHKDPLSKNNLYKSSYPIIHKQAKSQILNKIYDKQDLQFNNMKFKPLDVMNTSQKQFDLENSQALSDSRKLSLKNDKSLQLKIKNQQQTKMMEWIDQIDQEIIDNDQLYDQLNRHIEKLQDVIIKRNDEYNSDQ
ncbi:hypothetical protein TTHERM_00470450 (macronuclear) [Tetrahymena thermophila SB210]|uniref:Uncharacterized protein n=1 Tax=Tetrahymena thermophila (strain SB210) TaxID=312017 RepID=I7MD07_TETTS|nr:hypothetical protein TTHERM_00470450 [Tetrahymena thermophila SB210]EAR85272.2 hypothetical protein TTHERM_00470450 [Tetrahymena thermophila SB210]|eukprot:XP_001032935.2 hypothetical protein TTHERM_00470450 [Tetrahymena thermophila SB210]